MAERNPLIPNHGGYRRLASFKIGRFTYDITVMFCDHYADRRSRTDHQRMQAAWFAALVAAIAVAGCTDHTSTPTSVGATVPAVTAI